MDQAIDFVSVIFSCTQNESFLISPLKKKKKNQAIFSHQRTNLQRFARNQQNKNNWNSLTQLILQALDVHNPFFWLMQTSAAVFFLSFCVVFFPLKLILLLSIHLSSVRLRTSDRWTFSLKAISFEKHLKTTTKKLRCQAKQHVLISQSHLVPN